MNKKGVTILEILITTTIFSLLVLFASVGFKSFFSLVRINNGIATVTSALSSARYDSIKLNRKIRITIKSNKIFLEIYKNQQWQSHTDFDPGEKVFLAINATPVFFPGGFVVPLCSILIRSDIHSYKVSISIAGRIKVLKM